MEIDFGSKANIEEEFIEKFSFLSAGRPHRIRVAI